jgi:hypothetical protein
MPLLYIINFVFVLTCERTFEYMPMYEHVQIHMYEHMYTYICMYEHLYTYVYIYVIQMLYRLRQPSRRLEIWIVRSNLAWVHVGW